MNYKNIESFGFNMIYLNSCGIYRKVINMKDRRVDISVLFLLSIPVLVAISSLLTEFNIFDFSYLFFVGVIFGKYYYKTKRHN